jgi:hypothetical protein
LSFAILSSLGSGIFSGINSLFNIIVDILDKIIDFIKTIGANAFELALKDPKIALMLSLLIAYWFA